MESHNMQQICEAFEIPVTATNEPLSAALFLTVMHKVLLKNTEVKKKLELLDTRVTSLEGFKDSYDNYTDEVDLRMNRLIKRMEALEEPTRKRSFIVSGLEWKENITPRNVITQFLEEKFRLKLNIEKVIPIRSVRKFRVQLRDLADKAILFSKRGMLKGT
ncbi:unnamed protein product [Allacma fusca]|uniref:Uncharacterized protein n=1 Tax=Allacma fusca TaxID=39272 RepID=A0A8J2J0H2_9HEXA|nr:unnamed protein product [Allacma fusca]